MAHVLSTRRRRSARDRPAGSSKRWMFFSAASTTTRGTGELGLLEQRDRAARADHVDEHARRRPVEAEAHDAVDVARALDDLADAVEAVADVAEHDLRRSIWRPCPVGGQNTSIARAIAADAVQPPSSARRKPAPASRPRRAAR